MTTFSQVVDKMILETKRPDLASEIASYLNQTIRELHMEPKNGNIIFYRDNRKELQITADSDTAFGWAIPKPSVFQGLSAVRYDSQIIDGEMAWAQEVNPGRAQSQVSFSYYRSGPYVYFRGYGGDTSVISLAWFEFPASLNYYPASTRPAQYNDTDDWTYLDSITTDEAKAAAQLATANWLLLRWAVVIEEGLRAKVYKRLADTERARTSYSMYTTLRQGIYTVEVADTGGSA